MPPGMNFAAKKQTNPTTNPGSTTAKIEKMSNQITGGKRPTGHCYHHRIDDPTKSDKMLLFNLLFTFFGFFLLSYCHLLIKKKV